MLRCKVLPAILTEPLPTCSLEYLHFTCVGMNVFALLQQLVSSAPFMTSFSHPTHLLWLLCLFDSLFPFPIRDQTKSNCRDESTFASSWERVRAYLLFYCGRFKRVTARVARVTGVLNTIPEECTVLCSCITGWGDDEAVRGCLSHHHTRCVYLVGVIRMFLCLATFHC